MMKKVPKHIAIIMDGNRRWAKKRGLLSYKGHEAGVSALRKVVQCAGKIGISYLTVFAFSTENRIRDKIEVTALFNILAESLEKEVPELEKNNVSLSFIGNLGGLSKKLQKGIYESEKRLKNKTGLRLIVALNYGGRAEILEAAKKTKNFTEKGFNENLYTKNIPEPDLLIRTGGVFRISNFLLWQIAYCELYFTKTLWPDFNEASLKQAILDYNKRERRFGK